MDSSDDPVDWDDKLNFWRKIVIEYSKWCNTYVVTLEDIQKAFTIDSFSPSCLPTVFEIMERDGDLIHMSTIESEKEASQSDDGNFFVKMVSKTWKYLFSSKKLPIQPTTKLLVKSTCKIISDELKSIAEKSMSLEDKMIVIPKKHSDSIHDSLSTLSSGIIQTSLSSGSNSILNLMPSSLFPHVSAIPGDSTGDSVLLCFSDAKDKEENEKELRGMCLLTSLKDRLSCDLESLYSEVDKFRHSAMEHRKTLLARHPGNPAIIREDMRLKHMLSSVVRKKKSIALKESSLEKVEAMLASLSQARELAIARKAIHQGAAMLSEKKKEIESLDAVMEKVRDGMEGISEGVEEFMSYDTLGEKGDEDVEVEAELIALQKEIDEEQARDKDIDAIAASLSALEVFSDTPAKDTDKDGHKSEEKPEEKEKEKEGSFEELLF
ncbi:hypothetical protein ADUPG1_009625 [Aduncisulcus paluster]|uniref:Charged multivesicular body protein 7 n=1 Tax=Aduncisulcus paluster TaxID=2918883 RepID=A0ABQ5KZ15_9EUKA|nr:hypothetical protein ADUPG1_009625 [Aduncisulcus paluster]